MALRNLFLVLFLLPPTLAQFCGNRPFYRSAVGNASITILTDGPVFLGPSFFVTVPALAVRRSYQAAFRRTDPGVLQLNVLLFDTGRHRVLIDTGAFNTPPQFDDLFRNAGRLASSLKRARVDPDSIDAVILTHAHADHSAGLIDKKGNPFFRNAKVYVGRTEHEFWTSDPFPDVPTGLDQETLTSFGSTYLAAIAPYLAAGRVVLVNDGDNPLQGVSFIATPGHSPGHMSLELSADGETLLVTGDAWISRPDQVQNPEWGFAPETDREAAYKSRIMLLERAARKRERVLVYHEQYPGLGFVEKIGAVFDWVSEAGLTFGEDVCA